MRVAFIESREIVYLFEKIGEYLTRHGVEVHFLIFNKDYTPKSGIIHHIPYPNKDEIQHFQDPEYLKELIVSDRQQSIFKRNNTNHYQYYKEQIEGIISQIKPDMVFGEVASIQDLLCLHFCKSKGILYLNPLTCRFPTERFSFYLYDTLTPYLGSGDFLPKEQTIHEIDGIIHRKALPDYMRPIKKEPKQNKLFKYFKKSINYYKGDPNTPSPFIYYQLQKELNINKKEWEKVAYHSLKDVQFLNKPILLYPLQMQPEGNIDVYGKKYRNQTELIDKASKYLSSHLIVIKPNPKSNFELNADLVKLVKERDNVIPLSHNITMGEIFNISEIILTVTGTVAIESILSNKPLIILKKEFFNDTKASLYLEDLNDIQKAVNKLKEKYTPLNSIEKSQYFNNLRAKSYPGVISFKSAEDAKEVKRISNSFLFLIEQYKNKN